ncbi:MAG: hypothetical protein ACK4NW_02430 [Roseinatronobacter sp.]
MTRSNEQTQNRDDHARKRIEELLQNGKLPTLKSLLQRDDVNLDELALDLLTHQVEIEVQVEQLRVANEELDAERRKFETIFHDMPVAALLVDLESGAVSAENHKLRKLFPKRFSDTSGVHYLRHLGENRFDQDRISLGLADCRLGSAADVKAVSLIDKTPESYLMCDIRMARLQIGENSAATVLAIVQPYDRRF